MAHYIAGQGATQDRGTKVVLQNPEDTLDVKVLKAYDSNGLALKNSSGTTSLTLNETDGDVYVATNLGVGTADPSRALNVVSAENEVVRLDNTQEGGDCSVNYRTSHGTDVNWSTGVKGSDDSFRISNYTNVGTNDRITIDSAGKGGVGKDPATQLDVAGSLTATSGNDGGGTIAVRSGDASQYSKISVGTDSNKAPIGCPGASDTFFTGTAAGDLVLRADDNNNKIHLGAGTSGIAGLIVTEHAGTTPRIGVGVVDPDHALEILATSEQLKISYDADSFAGITVDEDSNLFLDPNGDGYIKLSADVRVKEDGFLGTDSGTVLLKFDGGDKKLIAGTTDNRTTLDITGGLITRVREVSAASDTVGADDFLITCDTSSNAVGLALPAATVVGKTYQFKDLGNAGTAGREITITANGSDTIDGDATLVIGSDYANAVLINTASGKWSVC